MSRLTVVALKGALGVSRKPELCVIWTQTGMISGNVGVRVQSVLLMYVLGQGVCFMIYFVVFTYV